MFDERNLDKRAYIFTKKTGKPTLYRDDFPRQARALAKLGATDKQLAEFFDIQETTLNNWKRKHPEFTHALKEGKLVADAEIANSLFNRAKGYEYQEVTKMKGTDANGEVYDYTKTINKHVPGDVKAQIFWLVNRMPEQWASVKKREESKTLRFDINQTLELGDLDQDQVKLLKSIAIRQLSNSEIEDIIPENEDS